MAYPTAILKVMDIEVSDAYPYYLYIGRLMILWGFDEHGLVTCEDSYTSGKGFVDIDKRPCALEDIWQSG